MTGALVVSIHDVSPWTWETTRSILAELESDGVGAVSLLVIPNHHHRGDFSDDGEFCEWLRGRVARGDEVVAHGYHHHRPERSGEGLVSRLITGVYTAGEGEFYDLSQEEAKELLMRGMDCFRRAGLHPTGFIAPAWLLGEAAEAAVREMGFRYTTRLREILRFHDERQWISQSLVWSVRSAWRRWVSLAWNATLATRLRSNPVMRVGIHPVDYEWPVVFLQIRRICRAALEDREAITYERWTDGRQS